MNRAGRIKAKPKGGAAVTLLAWLIALAVLLPVAVAVLNSLKTKGEIIASPLLPPGSPTLDNYRVVIAQSNFIAAFFNSVLITGGGIVLNLLISLPAGYALARWQSRMAGVLTILFLSSMFVPFHTIMIALLTTAKALHLTGSVPGLIVIYAALQCAIPIFLIRGFVLSLPMELEEAAVIDGCGALRVFTRIVVPLLKPVCATVAVLNALWIWNDFLLPYLILAKPITIPLSQMYFYGKYNQQWHYIMAGFVVSTLPVVVFFLIMQRFVVQGITAGAVKG
ncbi:MAG: carbohydrate ABC transporter permease [Bacillota bacterium]